MYTMRGKEDGTSVVVVVSEEEEERGGNNERIFVSVRLRPLNEREMAKSDVSEWECIDNKTIMFKPSVPPDHSSSSSSSSSSSIPTAYTFDRVFGSECSTEQVYWEAAKEVVLSVVGGINSTIFAYGQTSSGKTYTMIGITQHAVADIYEYVDKHNEREFVLKFSAMEIYNEAVRDLLSMDNSPLRLLDDPERGLVVEKLIEETLIDLNHLQDLLSICEAQRQAGETSLNETSSRSHQILRLTVESSTREHSGSGNFSTLTAAVNFVDLAGSERASQALSAGARLKEGSHINRSLLTLGTVIRKLSKGRSAHVPYRDSKLTRILQNSLGGNARTAIICTLSPARSHVDQSRNALSFASCAKEVTTNAQVNLVMSDKALVRQLQKELARLESQLSSLETTSTVDSAALLREKDNLIEKMGKEINELTWQRDLAQSHLKHLLNSVGENQPFRNEHAASVYSEVMNPPLPSIGLRRSDTDKDLCTKEILEISGCHEENFLLDDSTPKFSGPDPCHGWEEIAHRKHEESGGICKECIELEQPGVNGEAEALLPVSEEKEGKLPAMRDMNEEVVPFIKQEDKELKHIDTNNTYNALRHRIQELQETIKQLERSPSSEEVASNSKGLTWARSKSRRTVLMTIPSDLWSEKQEENESVPPPVSEKDFPQSENVARKYSRDSLNSIYAEEEVIKEIDVDVEDTTSVLDFVPGVNKIAKLQGLEVATSIDESIRSTSDTEGENGVRHPPTDWPLRFERYQRKIIDLWTRCNVPLVHRSYFFLLFKGDHSDSVYVEVELRRLYFLKDTYSRGTHSVTDGQIISLATSLKALNRERQFLAKQIQKKYGRKEREGLYQKWGIKLETRQRSLQLARCLWSDTRDMRHVKDSSVLVAKLVGFVEPRSAPKELFGLSFLTPSTSQRSSSWRDNMSSLL